MAPLSQEKEPPANSGRFRFAKAREKLESGKAQRVGLVSTNSIRGGANREVLDAIEETGRIFEAWSDEPWIVDGAAVRVSIVCFDREDGDDNLKLDGKLVAQINSDLTSSTSNLTRVARLKENLEHRADNLNRYLG